MTSEKTLSMIHCPVCNAPNHHLRVTCSACGSFIQQKVDNINLFEMLWKMIETPQKAFRSVALSKHKNYALSIGAGSGFGIAFFFFWIMKVGEFTDQFINILIAGLAIGPPLGVVFLLVSTIIEKIIFRIGGEKASFRDMFAITAYSFTPLMYSAIFILPLELITFGIYLFTRSPGVLQIKPISAIFLFGLDGVCVLWTVILNIIGMKMLYQSNWMKTILLVLLSLIVMTGLILFALMPFIAR